FGCPCGRLILRNVRDGSGRCSSAPASVNAARADGPKSYVPEVARSEIAIAGIPSSAPSNAPDTVPEYVTSSPRFHPLLMPDTIRSGLRPMMCEMARLTQSVGVPSMPNVFGPIVSMRSGRRSVSAWPMALASCIGATIVMLPRWPSAAASVLIPSEWTPSSLVTRMSYIGIFDCIGGNQQQQHSRDARERGACHKGHGGAKAVVEVAEQDACDERAHAGGRVVPAECRAAA